MPLVRNLKVLKDIQLGIWHITENVDELISQLYLNKEEFEILNNFKTESRKKQWLSYRVLIRNLVKIDTIYKIHYTLNGKPYLVNPPRNISVSHSLKYSATLITKNKDSHLGIDIEFIDNKPKKVKHKFLNPIELINLSVNPTDEKYTIYWSAKESIYKCYDKFEISLKENIFIYSLKKHNKHWIAKAKLYFKNKTEYFEIYCERIEDYILTFTQINK